MNTITPRARRVASLILATICCLMGKAWAEPYAYLPGISGALFVLDVATDQFVNGINIGGGPGGVGVHPDGSRIYVKNFNVETLSVIDHNDYSVLATVTVGLGPSAIAVLPDGSRIYVTLYDLNQVAVIDGTSYELIQLIAVDAGPFGIDVSPDGSRVYTANRYGNTVSVIDTATSSVLSNVPIGDGDGGIAVDAVHGRIYATSFNIDQISVIDANTSTVTATIPAEGAFGVALSPDGGRLYVANFSVDTLAIYDTATNALVASVPVVDGPYGIDISPDGLYAYVISYWDKTIAVIETTTNTYLKTITTPQRITAFSSFIGPSAPGGTLRGVQVNAIYSACINSNSGAAKGYVLPYGKTSWSCGTANVDMNPGDLVVMLHFGTRSATSTVLGGTVSGLLPSPLYVRCTNSSSGEMVEFLPSTEDGSWDCIEQGLEVAAGDAVIMYEIGIAK